MRENKFNDFFLFIFIWRQKNQEESKTTFICSTLIVFLTLRFKGLCSAYRRHLGPLHALTTDAQRRIQTLRDRISATSVREEQKTSVLNTIMSDWSRWKPAGRRAEAQNNP